MRFFRNHSKPLKGLPRIYYKCSSQLGFFSRGTRFMATFSDIIRNVNGDKSLNSREIVPPEVEHLHIWTSSGRSVRIVDVNSVNRVDSSGMTPLIYALLNNENVYVIRALLKAGADPNFVFLGKYTPIHLSLYTHRYTILQSLVAFGARYNAELFERNCPLKLALSLGSNIRVLGLLLGMGCSLKHAFGHHHFRPSGLLRSLIRIRKATADISMRASAALVLNHIVDNLIDRRLIMKDLAFIDNDRLKCIDSNGRNTSLSEPEKNFYDLYYGESNLSKNLSDLIDYENLYNFANSSSPAESVRDLGYSLPRTTSSNGIFMDSDPEVFKTYGRIPDYTFNRLLSSSDIMNDDVDDDEYDSVATAESSESISHLKKSRNPYWKVARHKRNVLSHTKELEGVFYSNSQSANLISSSSVNNPDGQISHENSEKIRYSDFSQRDSFRKYLRDLKKSNSSLSLSYIESKLEAELAKYRVRRLNSSLWWSSEPSHCGRSFADDVGADLSNGNIHDLKESSTMLISGPNFDMSENLNLFLIGIQIGVNERFYHRLLDHNYLPPAMVLSGPSQQCSMATFRHSKKVSIVLKMIRMNHPDVAVRLYSLGYVQLDHAHNHGRNNEDAFELRHRLSVPDALRAVGGSLNHSLFFMRRGMLPLLPTSGESPFSMGASFLETVSECRLLDEDESGNELLKVVQRFDEKMNNNWAIQPFFDEFVYINRQNEDKSPDSVGTDRKNTPFENSDILVISGNDGHSRLFHRRLMPHPDDFRFISSDSGIPMPDYPSLESPTAMIMKRLRSFLSSRDLRSTTSLGARSAPSMMKGRQRLERNSKRLAYRNWRFNSVLRNNRGLRHTLLKSKSRWVPEDVWPPKGNTGYITKKEKQPFSFRSLSTKSTTVANSAEVTHAESSTLSSNEYVKVRELLSPMKNGDGIQDGADRSRESNLQLSFSKVEESDLVVKAPYFTPLTHALDSMEHRAAILRLERLRAYYKMVVSKRTLRSNALPLNDGVESEIDPPLRFRSKMLTSLHSPERASLAPVLDLTLDSSSHVNGPFVRKGDEIKSGGSSMSDSTFSLSVGRSTHGKLLPAAVLVDDKDLAFPVLSRSMVRRENAGNDNFPSLVSGLKGLRSSYPPTEVDIADDDRSPAHLPNFNRVKNVNVPSTDILNDFDEFLRSMNEVAGSNSKKSLDLKSDDLNDSEELIDGDDDFMIAERDSSTRMTGSENQLKHPKSSYSQLGLMGLRPPAFTFVPDNAEDALGLISDNFDTISDFNATERVKKYLEMDFSDSQSTYNVDNMNSMEEFGDHDDFETESSLKTANLNAEHPKMSTRKFKYSYQSISSVRSGAGLECPLGLLRSAAAAAGSFREFVALKQLTPSISGKQGLHLQAPPSPSEISIVRETETVSKPLLSSQPLDSFGFINKSALFSLLDEKLTSTTYNASFVGEVNAESVRQSAEVTVSSLEGSMHFLASPIWPASAASLKSQENYKTTSFRPIRSVFLSRHQDDKGSEFADSKDYEDILENNLGSDSTVFSFPRNIQSNVNFIVRRGEYYLPADEHPQNSIYVPVTSSEGPLSTELKMLKLTNLQFMRSIPNCYRNEFQFSDKSILPAVNYDPISLSRSSSKIESEVHSKQFSSELSALLFEYVMNGDLASIKKRKAALSHLTIADVVASRDKVSSLADFDSPHGSGNSVMEGSSVFGTEFRRRGHSCVLIPSSPQILHSKLSTLHLLAAPVSQSMRQSRVQRHVQKGTRNSSYLHQGYIPSARQASLLQELTDLYLSCGMTWSDRLAPSSLRTAPVEALGIHKLDLQSARERLQPRLLEALFRSPNGQDSGVITTSGGFQDHSPYLIFLALSSGARLTSENDELRISAWDPTNPFSANQSVGEYISEVFSEKLKKARLSHSHLKSLVEMETRRIRYIAHDPRTDSIHSYFTKEISSALLHSKSSSSNSNSLITLGSIRRFLPHWMYVLEYLLVFKSNFFNNFPSKSTVEGRKSPLVVLASNLPSPVYGTKSSSDFNVAHSGSFSGFSATVNQAFASKGRKLEIRKHDYSQPLSSYNLKELIEVHDSLLMTGSYSSSPARNSTSSANSSLAALKTQIENVLVDPIPESSGNKKIKHITLVNPVSDADVSVFNSMSVVPNVNSSLKDYWNVRLKRLFPLSNSISRNASHPLKSTSRQMAFLDRIDRLLLRYTKSAIEFQESGRSEILGIAVKRSFITPADVLVDTSACASSNSGCFISVANDQLDNIVDPFEIFERKVDDPRRFLNFHVERYASDIEPSKRGSTLLMKLFDTERLE